MYLDGKPFEITRVDDWNVELMDRSVQNPQPRLEQKDSFMRLVQQNERSSFTDTYRQYSEIKVLIPTASCCIRWAISLKPTVRTHRP